MNQSRPLLKLGLVDSRAKPSDLNAFFSKYHEGGMLGQNKFRGEKDSQWIPLQEIDGNHVRDLQSKLRDFSFYPHGEVDGIFGYRTLSAVRLFQEFVQSVENIVDIGTTDGIVGTKTHAHIQPMELRRKASRLGQFLFPKYNTGVSIFERSFELVPSDQCTTTD